MQADQIKFQNDCKLTLNIRKGWKEINELARLAKEKLEKETNELLG